MYKPCGPKVLRRQKQPLTVGKWSTNAVRLPSNYNNAFPVFSEESQEVP